MGSDPLKDSWLYRGRTAFSMCTGAGTAESSRAVLQSVINKYPLPGCHLEMDFRTVAIWETRFSLLLIIALTFVFSQTNLIHGQ